MAPTPAPASARACASSPCTLSSPLLTTLAIATVVVAISMSSIRGGYCADHGLANDAPQAGPAWLHQAKDGSLHINTTAGQPVKLNGVDVLQRLQSLEMVCRDQNSSLTSNNSDSNSSCSCPAAPTAAPTTADPPPTAAPTAPPTDSQFGSKVWTRQVGGPRPRNDRGLAVATDGQDMVYVLGVVRDSLGGNPHAGQNDVVLLKYDQAGALLWVAQLGSSEDDVPGSLAVDDVGMVYVTGIVEGNLLGLGHAGLDDLFVAKFHSNGTRLWAQVLGTVGYDRGKGIAVDKNNESRGVYVCGTTNGDIAGSAGDTDMVLVKFDGSTGAQLWAQQIGSGAFDDAVDVAVDSKGEVVLVGFTQGSLYSSSSNSNGDLIVAKFASNGTVLWSQQYGESVTLAPTAVAINIIARSGSGSVADGDDDDAIFVTGTVFGDFDGSGGFGKSDLFLVKHHSNGTVLWTRQLGTSEGEFAEDVATDSNNDAYIVGWTTNSLDNGIFVMKFAGGDGTRVWAQQYGVTSLDKGLGVATDSRNNVFVSGLTRGPLDGNAYAGEDDLFLSKFGVL